VVIGQVNHMDSWMVKTKLIFIDKKKRVNLYDVKFCKLRVCNPFNNLDYIDYPDWCVLLFRVITMW